MWLTEFLVVAAGVLLALWTQQWAEGRRQRALAREYLLSLRQDLEADLFALGGIRERLKRFTAAVEHVLDVVDGRRAGLDDPAAFLQAATTCHFFEFFDPATTTLQELSATGNLRTVAHRPAIRAVLRYHARVATSYRTRRYYLDRLWKGLESEVRKHVDRRVFPRAMDAVYRSVAPRLDAPHGDPEGYDSFLTTSDAVVPFDIKAIRGNDALRDQLLDALEVHAIHRGELDVYERLCRETLAGLQ